MDSKSKFFLSFCENVDIVKIVVFLSKIDDFKVSALEKSLKNRSESVVEKSIAKKCQKLDFGLDFGSILGGLGLKNRQKIEKYQVSNEVCFATLWTSPGNHRKPTGVVAFGRPIRLGI